MAQRPPLENIMAPDWAEAMRPIEGQIRRMGDFLRGEVASGNGYLPAGDKIFAAFTQPLQDVRVLIIGQDPYPTPGHPIGLSFAVEPTVTPLPKSLVNIYQELDTDMGIAPATHGDLRPWTRQGVMLLNRVLSVRPHQPASHRNQGWETITEHAISCLVAREQPLVALLWGRQAQSLRPLLGDTPVIASAHPSPLSASRGFFGSRPFSKTNAALRALGSVDVDWRVGV